MGLKEDFDQLMQDMAAKKCTPATTVVHPSIYKQMMSGSWPPSSVKLDPKPVDSYEVTVEL